MSPCAGMVLQWPRRASWGLSILPFLLPLLEPAFLLLPWQRWPEVLLRAGWAAMLLRPEQVRGSGLSLRKAGPGGLSCLRKAGRGIGERSAQKLLPGQVEVPPGVALGVGTLELAGPCYRGGPLALRHSHYFTQSLYLGLSSGLPKGPAASWGFL